MKSVNKSIPKKDGVMLGLGYPAYTDDLAPRNALIVKVLRSPYASAEIIDIDIDDAKKIPGVIDIITHNEVSSNRITRAGQGFPEPSPKDKRILDNYVRYVGDEIAAVAAIDEQSANKALDKIRVEYKVFEPIIDFENAKGNQNLVHREMNSYSIFPIGFLPKKNIAASYRMSFGEIDKELEKCSYIVEERYYTQAQAHVTSEPHSCFGYLDIQGRIVLVSSTQTPFHVRRIVSSALEIDISKVRVIKPRIGGGYGGKQQIHGELLVAMLVIRTKKPCKLVYTRKEVFESTCSRHPMRIDIKIGANNSGLIKAIDMKILSDTGAYGEHALTVFMVAASKTLPLYNRVNSVNLSGDVVYTNRGSAGAFRGYGAIQGNYALESTIDILAEKISISPFELRKLNMIREGETSKIFELMGEGTKGTPMKVESCKLEYCVNKVSELIEKNRHKTDKEFIKVGRGIAIAMQGSGIPKIDMGASLIKLNDDGFFNLFIGATDIGTGSDTILSQIAAEAIGVTVDKIIPYSSDTDLTPFDTGAYASSTTYVSGNAVKKSGDAMRKELIKNAAIYLSTSEEDIEFNGVEFESKNLNKRITLKELSNKLTYSFNQSQLVSNASYCGNQSPPPYMCGGAEVEVNTITGEIKVVNYYAVVDCGTCINPKLARVQVEGAVLQGIGMTLYEEVKYDSKGYLLTNNSLNYRIPSRCEAPNMFVEFAKSYEPSGPYGAKSVGEIGIDTPPAAIANAIYDAIGVRFTSLPITSEMVLRKLSKKNEI